MPRPSNGTCWNRSHVSENQLNSRGTSLDRKASKDTVGNNVSGDEGMNWGRADVSVIVRVQAW